MKGIVIFFDDKNSKYGDEKIFSGFCAKQLAETVMENVKKATEKCTIENIYTITEADSYSSLMDKMIQYVLESSADFVIYSYKDLPFLNEDLIHQMIYSHLEYKAEYTFADGYPYGFAPEIIDSGCLKILCQLSKTTQKSIGDAAVSRESFFNLIKTDINSFEVETVLAKTDWRLLRLNFDCADKAHFIECKSVYDGIGEKVCDAEEICEFASRNVECLKTVPGFYELQISGFVSYKSIYSPWNSCSDEKLSYEKFEGLFKKIADFSEGGVISLSAWGEAFSHPELLKMIEKILSVDSFSVFIETDGQLITEEICSRLADIVNKASPRTNHYAPVMITVKIDAFSAKTYKIINPDSLENSLEKCLESVRLLNAAVPGSVYPQFTRMQQNEEELESFFRYWNEKSNPSGGNLVIQKYNDYTGFLPPCKPADLSPLVRNPCWHLRRDMVILLNGDVPSCRNCIKNDIIGNVYEESLEEIWKKNNDLLLEHINKKYCNKCGKCDEYYTYNF